MLLTLSIAEMNSARFKNFVSPAKRSQGGDRRLYHVGMIT
jgi:hypothetical protein